MACQPVSYSGVTASIFNSMKGELEKNGFSVPGTSGTIRGPFGIVMQYAYDEATETLNVEVLEKNFFVSCDQIYNQLDTTLGKFTA